MKDQKQVFSDWHESKYGESVAWVNGSPASHIHNDRWQGWAAGVSQDAPQDNALLAAVLDSVQKLGSGDFVLAPREPTEKMLEAGYQDSLDAKGFEIKIIYKAMIESI